MHETAGSTMYMYSSLILITMYVYSSLILITMYMYSCLILIKLLYMFIVIYWGSKVNLVQMVVRPCRYGPAMCFAIVATFSTKVKRLCKHAASSSSPHWLRVLWCKDSGKLFYSTITGQKPPPFFVLWSRHSTAEIAKSLRSNAIKPSFQ